MRGDWELFAYGAGELVRVELASGRVTRTPIDDLVSEAPVSLIVGTDRVLIHSWEGGDGYLVPDGRPSRDQPQVIARAEAVLPGPRPNQVWLHSSRDDGGTLTPATMSGRKAGRPITVPPGFWAHSTDYRGGVLVGGVGGEYLLDRTGVHRITTGALLAAGPTRFLALVCDDRAACRTEVIDRSTGAARRLSGDVHRGDVFASGVISPDGETAVVIRHGSAGAPGLRLVNLATGATRQVPVTVNDTLGTNQIAWSPDSRWLVVAAESGVLIVDTVTTRKRWLWVPTSAVEAVAVRE